MKTALITHPACLEHDTGPGHPERADRLRAVLQALDGPDFADLLRETPPHVDDPGMVVAVVQDTDATGEVQDPPPVGEVEVRALGVVYEFAAESE